MHSPWPDAGKIGDDSDHVKVFFRFSILSPPAFHTSGINISLAWRGQKAPVDERCGESASSRPKGSRPERRRAPLPPRRTVGTSGAGVAHAALVLATDTSFPLSLVAGRAVSRSFSPRHRSAALKGSGWGCHAPLPVQGGPRPVLGAPGEKKEGPGARSVRFQPGTAVVSSVGGFARPRSGCSTAG